MTGQLVSRPVGARRLATAGALAKVAMEVAEIHVAELARRRRSGARRRLLRAASGGGGGPDGVDPGAGGGEKHVGLQGQRAQVQVILVEKVLADLGRKLAEEQLLDDDAGLGLLVSSSVGRRANILVSNCDGL